MSRSFPAALTCVHCGERFEFLVWQSVNTTLSPGMVDKVARGDVFRVPCEHCNGINPVDYPLHYHDMAHSRYCVYMADEGGTESMRSALELAASLFSKTGDYSLWTVDSPRGLQELAMVWRDGLDDLAVLAAKTTLYMLTVSRGAHSDFLGYVERGADGCLVFEAVFGDGCAQRQMAAEDFEKYRPFVASRRSSVAPPNTWAEWSLETGKRLLAPA